MATFGQAALEREPPFKCKFYDELNMNVQQFYQWLLKNSTASDACN